MKMGYSIIQERGGLFVAAMAVVRMKEPNGLKDYYERLLAKEKAKMVALIARLLFYFPYFSVQ